MTWSWYQAFWSWSSLSGLSLQGFAQVLLDGQGLRVHHGHIRVAWEKGYGPAWGPEVDPCVCR